MDPHVDFDIVKTQDDKIKFIGAEAEITAREISYCDGKHYMTEPHTAHAHFQCEGKKYLVDNANGLTTVEDWYNTELLPKIQMLRILLSGK
jgi:hypothetical protein